MAYRHTDLGLLVRFDKKAAAKTIEDAFKATDDGKEGRASDKAATYLGLSPATLKRMMAQLKDSGFEVKHYTKRPGDDPEAIPGRTSPVRSTRPARSRRKTA